MDQNIKQQLQQYLARAQNIEIIVSEKLGFEGLASGLAFLLSLKKLNKNVTINAKNPTVQDARMLYGVDKIDDRKSGNDLIIGIQNAVQNVDKVTYFLDGEKLKIVVHALHNSKGVSQNDVTFESYTKKCDLIISMGFVSQDEMYSEITHEQQYDPNTPIVNLSTSTKDINFAQININNPIASGITEVTSEIIELLSLPVDEDISFNLYSGLAASTQMFSPTKTTENVLKIASWLLKFGAGKASLSQATARSQQTNKVLDQEAQSIRRNALASQPFEFNQSPINQIEEEKRPQKDWLKPPKIYHGSKSFDIES